MSAPTALFGLGAGLGDDVPNLLVLRGQGHRKADINAAEESNGLANLHQLAEFGVDEGEQGVSGETLLLPVVQDIELDAAAVG